MGAGPTPFARARFLEEETMEFGVCVASKIDDIDAIVLAEELGYSHAWLADSQMIWSDCYATLALAAVRTRKIQLGTGVAVAGTRLAPVTAHSIATINRLAPGRTFLGLGAGNTALRLMGHKPRPARELADAARTIRLLLEGEEVDFAWEGQSAPVRFLMPELGFIALTPRIPIYISGFGPKSQGVAGAWGDGLVLSIPPEPAFLDRALAAAERGARDAGRPFDRARFLTASLTQVALCDEGESLGSERIVRECGPFVVSSLHYLYDQAHQFGKEPPPHVRPFWREYCELVERTPERRRHLRVHAGHCTYLLDEEARFVTADLIRATCLAGTAAEVIAQIERLASAGLRQLFLLPALATQRAALERFARAVMPRFGGARPV